MNLRPLSQIRYGAKLQEIDSICRALFSQRRKMARKALKPLISNTEEIMTQLGISPTARAEELTLEQFAQLAACLAAANSCAS